MAEISVLTVMSMTLFYARPFAYPYFYSAVGVKDAMLSKYWVFFSQNTKHFAYSIIEVSSWVTGSFLTSRILSAVDILHVFFTAVRVIYSLFQYLEKLQLLHFGWRKDEKKSWRPQLPNHRKNFSLLALPECWWSSICRKKFIVAINQSDVLGEVFALLLCTQ